MVLLDSDSVDFFIRLEQFVANLDEQAEGHVGFLNGRKDFGLAHVFTAEHGCHLIVGVCLHLADVSDALAEHV